MDVNAKKGRRLFEIKVKAVALVDRPAIMRKFLLLKRAAEMEKTGKTITELVKQATSIFQAIHEECMKRKEAGTAPAIDKDEQEEKKRAEEGNLDAIDFMTEDEWNDFQETVSKSFHALFGPFRFERNEHDDEDEEEEEEDSKKPRGIRRPAIPFEAEKTEKHSVKDDPSAEDDIPEEVVEIVAGLCGDLVELAGKD